MSPEKVGRKINAIIGEIVIFMEILADSISKNRYTVSRIES